MDRRDAIYHCSLLRDYNTPTSFDALHLDLDGDELPVLTALLTAGYTPKLLSLNLNIDVPPPIQMHWREPSAALSRRHGQRLLAGAVTAGLGSATADAYYSLLVPRGYSLLGFSLGRYSRWCQRCERRMWFARSVEVLGLPPSQTLLTWQQMVKMFWSVSVASNELPKLQAGKLLSHSNTWAYWKTKFEGQEAAMISDLAWNGTRLDTKRTDNEPKPFGGPPVNTSLKGWCIHADPCPLHVVTHAPRGTSVLGDDLPLSCDLETLARKGIDLTPRVSGGFAQFSYKPALYSKITERLASGAGAAGGVCAYAQDMVRRAIERACEHAGHGAVACPLVEGGGGSNPVELAVTRFDEATGRTSSVTCGTRGTHSSLFSF